MQTISARMPVAQADGHLAVIVIGGEFVDYGERVLLEEVYAKPPATHLPMYYVGGIDIARIGDIAPDVLKLWGLSTSSALVAMLERIYRTGLSEYSEVTIYSLYQEKFWEQEEEEN